MKFCVKCGHQLEDDANFCPKCGAKSDSLKETDSSLEQSQGGDSAAASPADEDIRIGQEEIPASVNQPVPQPHKASQVYASEQTYTVPDATPAAQNKNGMAFPILAIALALFASFSIGLYISALWYFPDGFTKYMQAARLLIYLVIVAAAVFGAIGLMRSIRSKKIPGIIISGLAVYNAISCMSLLSLAPEIAEFLSRFIGQ